MHPDAPSAPPSHPAPRQGGRPRLSFSFLAILVLGLGLGFEMARAESDAAISGAARVVKPGVIEVQDRELALYGILNPKGGQACVRNAKPWNCAEGARTALRQHLEGRKVRCVPTEKDDDVARCTLGDVDLSALLVREGWARADRDAGKDYVEQEKEARKARRGIWATDENPEEVRRQQQRNY